LKNLSWVDDKNWRKVSKMEELNMIEKANKIFQFCKNDKNVKFDIIFEDLSNIPTLD
jgi:hypothetical protein